jgi:hypothetical protein
MSIEVVAAQPLKGVLAVRGITNREFARKHNFSAAFVGRVNNGRCAPTPRFRAAAVEETGLSEAELFRDDAVQAAARRLVEQAVASGLPATVDDPESLRRIATIMRAAS